MADAVRRTVLRLQFDEKTAQEGEALFRAKERAALAADDWLRAQLAKHPNGKDVDVDRDAVVYDPWTGRTTVHLQH